MSTIIKDLGAVTAYAYAVEQGYEGTQEEFAQLMASYAEVAIEAEASAQSAALSAETATAQAQSASDSADEASASAATAGTKADEASQSASLASGKASDASTYADTATTKAGEAASSAASASQSASSAASDAATITALISTAEGYAERAEAAVTAAEGFAEDASDSATSAESSATSASGSATTATQKAAAASGSASAAMDSALKSEGYAVGKQNGTDVGSDSPYYHNNAKYYAEEASGSATSASGSASTSSTKASEASTSATSASESATEASGYASSAQESAESAEASAQTVSEAVERLEEIDHKAPVIISTASGAIASFADGADDMPCKSVVCNVDAVQDLHGQDAPYPAGGGKNKFPVATFTSQAAKNVFNNYPLDLPSGTYTLSFVSNVARTANFTVSIKLSDNTSIDEAISANSSTVTFTANEDITAITWYVREASDVKDIQIESGDTATAYAPYSNLCPITGWDGVTVVRKGTNLCDPQNPETIMLGEATRYGYVFGAGTYNLIASVSNKAYIRIYQDDITSAQTINMPTSVSSRTIPDGYHMAVYFVNQTDGQYVCVSPNAISNFVPYVPADTDSHSLSFPQTVYGGWVDVIKGELHVTHGQIASYNGETLPGAWISDRNAYIQGTTPTTGAQVVYELATEQVIPLDPVTITTLFGNNNVYCNTGNSSVEYPADTKLYIEHLTAPDHDMIADSNIASGKFFMVGNSLYISTSAIAQGETIKVGTNCTQINLAQALNNLAEA